MSPVFTSICIPRIWVDRKTVRLSNKIAEIFVDIAGNDSKYPFNVHWKLIFVIRIYFLFGALSDLLCNAKLVPLAKYDIKMGFLRVICMTIPFCMPLLCGRFWAKHWCKDRPFFLAFFLAYVSPIVQYGELLYGLGKKNNASTDFGRSEKVGPHSIPAAI